jgi:hypothetical protein
VVASRLSGGQATVQRELEDNVKMIYERKSESEAFDILMNGWEHQQEGINMKFSLTFVQYARWI